MATRAFLNIKYFIFYSTLIIHAYIFICVCIQVYTYVLYIYNTYIIIYIYICEITPSCVPVHAHIIMEDPTHSHPQWDSARGRQKRTARVLAPGGARCQFVTGSGAPTWGSVGTWPKRKLFAALVAIAMMLGSN